MEAYTDRSTYWIILKLGNYTSQKKKKTFSKQRRQTTITYITQLRVAAYRRDVVFPCRASLIFIFEMYSTARLCMNLRDATGRWRQKESVTRRYVRYSSFSSISNSLRLTEFNSTHVKPFQTPLKKKKKQEKSQGCFKKKRDSVSSQKLNRAYKYTVSVTVSSSLRSELLLP